MRRLRYTLDSTGIRFIWDAKPAEPLPLPLSAHFDLDAFLNMTAADRRGLETLDSAYVTGLLDNSHGGLLSWNEYYDLDELDRRALDLPEPEPLSCHILSREHMGSSDFRVTCTVSHPVHGQLEGFIERAGPAYKMPGQPVIASQQLSVLLHDIDQSPGLDSIEQLRYVARLKALAVNAGATLDGYLANEDVREVDTLVMDVYIDSPQHADISLDFSEPMPAGARESLAGLRSNEQVVQATAEGGRRVRGVLSDPALQSIAQVQSKPELSGIEIPKFLTAPESVLGPEFDLSQFSARVTGIVPKVAQAKARLSFKPTGRDWFSVEVSYGATPATLAEEVQITSEANGPDANESMALRGETARADGASPELTLEQVDELVGSSDDDFVLAPDGTWIEVDRQQLSQLKQATARLKQEFPDGLPRSKQGYVLEVLSNIDELEYSEPARSEMEGVTSGTADLPQLRDITLHKYQIDGIGWLWQRANAPLRNGAMLADQMGLGKTMQAIALLATLAEKGRLTPSLVVLPGSLLEKWKFEMVRHCPGLPIPYEHHGPQRIRALPYIASQSLTLTTYETLRTDQLLLAQIPWQTLICDESQKVKNPGAGITRALKALKAKNKVALSGTPVENNLEELWCQYDMLLPGYLGSRADFKQRWARSIEDPERGEEEKAAASQNLRDHLGPYFKRRLKRDHLPGLPPMEEERIDVRMGTQQLDRYNAIRKRASTTTLGGRMALLGELIQVCSHPFALGNEAHGKSSRDLVSACPKLEATLNYLAQVKQAGERALIFTRFKRVQRIIHQVVTELLLSPVYPILNGEVPFGQRSAAIDIFNSARDFGVLVLSPEATGVGLDIYGANHVIHYTRLWNPAKESQATARAHRLGQRLPVTIFYPIVTGSGFLSVEQNLDELLKHKEALAEDVIRPTSQFDVQDELWDRVMEQPA